MLGVGAGWDLDELLASLPEVGVDGVVVMGSCDPVRIEQLGQALAAGLP